MRLEEGLSKSFDTDGKRGLVVLDDLMAETDGRVTNLYTKKNHHSDTSVIYIVQNLFTKNKESRTISLNSQYMDVFKNPRDASQFANLARQMYPGRGAFVQEAFADATASPYGYLLIDLKQNTPTTCACACPYCRTIGTLGYQRDQRDQMDQMDQRDQRDRRLG